VWEHTVKQILIACGVFKQDELKIDATPYDDCLSVHGRCDFIAGGFIEAELAYLNIKELHLPDYMVAIADKIVDALAGKVLSEKILELKSVSTFAFDKVERMGEPMPNHSLQGYHYQKNGKIPADVCYICKDDCRSTYRAVV
jgi:hypothetical protein